MVMDAASEGLVQMSSLRGNVWIVFWCAISSLVLIGLSFGLGQARRVDLIWTIFVAVPYLLMALFLGIGRAYVGLILALEVGRIAFILMVWALAVAIGQTQGFIDGKRAKLIYPFIFIFLQGALALSAGLTIHKIPEVARRPRAWTIVVATLLGLYGLSSIAGWLIGQDSGGLLTLNAG